MKKTPKKNNKASKVSPKEALYWYFPSTNHGREDGFADSGIETFVGDYKKYIARETIQNSVDARLDYSQPVRVEFDHSEMPVKDMPGHEMLSDRIDRCMKFITGQEKAEIFFKGAASLLKGSKMPVLKISDFNTVGLSGSDDDRAGNWYRLVRVTGTSSPKGVAGGSFGIGKGAPFAGSSIRTVFYSSVNEKDKPVFQGVSRLVSHYDDDKDVRQGIGFFGIEGYKAVRDSETVPAGFKRTERGTDIFIMGFKSDPDWKAGLIRSVLNNFWLTILHGDLEVVVKDGTEILINKETIGDLFDEYEAHNAKCFFEAVTLGQKFNRDLRHLGNVSLFVRKQENYPSKIMKARKPKMLVREDRYSILREPYAGVFLCEDAKGNTLLRDLEPPAHDEWDKNRAENGSVVLRELDLFIRESLRSLGETLVSEPQDIPGLSQYLPDSDDRDDISKQGVPLDPTELFDKEETGREVGAIKDPAPADVNQSIKRSAVVKSIAPGKGDNGGGDRNDSNGGEKAGKRGGDMDGTNTSERIRTADISFRGFVQKHEGEIEYHFVINAREDCDGSLRLVAIGDDVTYPADIKSVINTLNKKSYETSGSMIKGLSIKRGEILKLAVRLQSPKKYAIGIENYES